ncbi:hypothetical protein TGCAST_387430, partial [Toxoplasma gondii CAST]
TSSRSSKDAAEGASAWRRSGRRRARRSAECGRNAWCPGLPASAGPDSSALCKANCLDGKRADEEEEQEKADESTELCRQREDEVVECVIFSQRSSLRIRLACLPSREVWQTELRRLMDARRGGEESVEKTSRRGSAKKVQTVKNGTVRGRERLVKLTSTETGRLAGVESRARTRTRATEKPIAFDTRQGRRKEKK